ncbi:TolB family protein [Sinomonas gamaensis]|uniref:TolB family protein n=1 Tax=Sinomonas gamaensis TaxID=2565624 RepID=UPI0011094F2D|nr:PD40 domain-containing protein [Sinomonas gamaensis]
MTHRTRLVVLIAIIVLALGAAGGYGVWAYAQYQAESRAPSQVPVAASAPAGPVIFFRNTASGQGQGQVASVPAAAPQSPRTLTPQACDRVYAAAGERICLRTKLGLENTTDEQILDADWHPLRTRTLTGLPSRARLSADGQFAASTVFVSGHAYTGGFSTSTEISATGGESFGNLEDYTLEVPGATLTPQERNVWGVTFAKDGDTFYATVGSADRNWLVRGSIGKRMLTAIHAGVECPSLSPDGTRIAFKIKSPDPNLPQVRLLAVLELRTDQVTRLGEGRSVDDQAEWLDDSTLLYGMARGAPVGDSDIWSIPADGSGNPSLFIQHASSPSVLRP